MNQFTKLTLVCAGLFVVTAAALALVAYRHSMDSANRGAIRENQTPSELSWAPAAAARPTAAAVMRQACGRDMQLLCPEVEPGQGRIFQCLAQRQGDVSETCGSYLRRAQTEQGTRLAAQSNNDRTSNSSDAQGRTESQQLAPPPRADPGRQMVAACGADMRKLCADVQPGQGRKARCLVEKKDELTSGCRTYLQELPIWRSAPERAEGRKIVSACGEYMKQFCEGIEPGGGRVVACLRGRKSEISSECQSTLAELPGGSR